MSYLSRLEKSFRGAPRLPLSYNSSYVLFSDCHRGVGTANDNFLQNRTLYLAALQYYWNRQFTYIELGDGDELWENRSLHHIQEVHEEVFDMLCQFFRQGRCYMLYGNHDMEKKEREGCLFPGLEFYSGIILESTYHPGSGDIYLTHGHQAELLNSTFWKLSRFLVRYFWKPLERYGVRDPTSAAKNNRRKEKTEQRLQRFARQKQQLLITGHTHRPYLRENDSYYCNSGSCIHPYSITCLEINRNTISLIKWSLDLRRDNSLCVSRKILSGPVPLKNL